jgi:hypothetical protein
MERAIYCRVLSKRINREALEISFLSERKHRDKGQSEWSSVFRKQSREGKH